VATGNKSFLCLAVLVVPWMFDYFVYVKLYEFLAHCSCATYTVSLIACIPGLFENLFQLGEWDLS